MADWLRRKPYRKPHRKTSQQSAVAASQQITPPHAAVHAAESTDLLADAVDWFSSYTTDDLRAFLTKQLLPTPEDRTERDSRFGFLSGSMASLVARAVILKQYASKYPEQPLVNLFQTLPLYELELKTDDACKLADILELEEMLTPEKIVIYRLLKFNVQQDGQSGSIDSCQAFKRLCERLGTLFPKVDEKCSPIYVPFVGTGNGEDSIIIGRRVLHAILPAKYQKTALALAFQASQNFGFELEVINKFKDSGLVLQLLENTNHLNCYYKHFCLAALLLPEEYSLRQSLKEHHEFVSQGVEKIRKLDLIQNKTIVDMGELGPVQLSWHVVFFKELFSSEFSNIFKYLVKTDRRLNDLTKREPKYITAKLLIKPSRILAIQRVARMLATLSIDYEKPGVGQPEAASNTRSPLKHKRTEAILTNVVSCSVGNYEIDASSNLTIYQVGIDCRSRLLQDECGEDLFEGMRIFLQSQRANEVSYLSPIPDDWENDLNSVWLTPEELVGNSSYQRLVFSLPDGIPMSYDLSSKKLECADSQVILSDFGQFVTVQPFITFVSQSSLKMQPSSKGQSSSMIPFLVLGMAANSSGSTSEVNRFISKRENLFSKLFGAGRSIPCIDAHVLAANLRMVMYSGTDLLDGKTDELYCDFNACTHREIVAECKSNSKLLLDHNYWRKRLILNASEEGKHVLIELLSDAPGDTKKYRVAVVEVSAFQKLVDYCITAGEANPYDMQRPLIMQFCVEKSNLYAIRKTLFDIAASSVTVVAMIDVREHLSLSELLLLIAPFAEDEHTTVRMIIIQAYDILDDLMTSHIAANILPPETTKMVSPQQYIPIVVTDEVILEALKQSEHAIDTSNEFRTRTSFQAWLDTCATLLKAQHHKIQIFVHPDRSVCDKICRMTETFASESPTFRSDASTENQVEIQRLGAFDASYPDFFSKFESALQIHEAISGRTIVNFIAVNSLNMLTLDALHSVTQRAVKAGLHILYLCTRLDAVATEVTIVTDLESGHLDLEPVIHDFSRSMSAGDFFIQSEVSDEDDHFRLCFFLTWILEGHLKWDTLTKIKMLRTMDQDTSRTSLNESTGQFVSLNNELLAILKTDLPLEPSALTIISLAISVWILDQTEAQSPLEQLLCDLSKLARGEEADIVPTFSSFVASHPLAEMMSPQRLFECWSKRFLGKQYDGIYFNVLDGSFFLQLCYHWQQPESRLVYYKPKVFTRTDMFETDLLQAFASHQQIDWNNLSRRFAAASLSTRTFIRIIRCSPAPLRLLAHFNALDTDSQLQGANSILIQQLRSTFFDMKLRFMKSMITDDVDTCFRSFAVVIFHLEKDLNPEEISSAVVNCMLQDHIVFRLGGADPRPLLQVLLKLDSVGDIITSYPELYEALERTLTADDIDGMLLCQTDVVSDDPAPTVGSIFLELLKRFPSSANIRKSKLAKMLYPFSEKPILETSIQTVKDHLYQLSNLINEHCLNPNFVLLSKGILKEMIRFLCDDESAQLWFIVLSSNFHSKVNIGDILGIPPYLSCWGPIAHLMGLKSYVLCDSSHPQFVTLRILHNIASHQPIDPAFFSGVEAGCNTLSGVPLEEKEFEQARYELVSHLVALSDDRQRMGLIRKLGKQLTSPSLQALLKATCEKLLSSSMGAKSSIDAIKCTYLGLWMLVPVSQMLLLPSSHMNHLLFTQKEFDLLKSWNEPLQFFHNVRSRSIVPQFAQWFVSPATLPLQTFVSVCKSFGHIDGAHKLEQCQVVSAQSEKVATAGGETARPIRLTITKQNADGRHILRDAQEIAKGLFHSDDSPVALKGIIFVLDQGCDENLMALNLNALCLINSKRRPVCQTLVDDDVRRLNGNLTCIQNILCVWFDMLCIREADLDQAIRIVTTDQYFAFQPCAHFQKVPRDVPLPAFIDVHLRESHSLVQYFGDSAEDKDSTVQAFTNFAGPTLLEVAQDISYDELEEKATYLFVKNLRAPSDPEDLVTMFACATVEFYRQGGRARNYALNMLRKSFKELIQLPNFSIVFKFFILGVGFSDNPFFANRDAPSKPDNTGLKIIQETFKVLCQLSDHNFTLCENTFKDAYGFWKEHDEKDHGDFELLKKRLVLTDSQENCGIASMLPRVIGDKKMMPWHKLIHDLNSSPESECHPNIVKEMLDEDEASEPYFVSLPGGFSGVDVNKAPKSQLSSHVTTQGIIGFNFSGNDQVVIRAPELFRLDVSMQKSTCLVQAINFIPGNGGALAVPCMSPLSEKYRNTSADYIFIKKSKLWGLPRERFKIMQIFHSNLEAFKFFIQACPLSTLLIGENILMKKCEDDWHPLFTHILDNQMTVASSISGDSYIENLDDARLESSLRPDDDSFNDIFSNFGGEDEADLFTPGPPRQLKDRLKGIKMLNNLGLSQNLLEFLELLVDLANTHESDDRHQNLARSLDQLRKDNDIDSFVLKYPLNEKADSFFRLNQQFLDDDACVLIGSLLNESKTGETLEWEKFFNRHIETVYGSGYTVDGQVGYEENSCAFLFPVSQANYKHLTSAISDEEMHPHSVLLAYPPAQILVASYQRHGTMLSNSSPSFGFIVSSSNEKLPQGIPWLLQCATAPIDPNIRDYFLESALSDRVFPPTCCNIDPNIRISDCIIASSLAQRCPLSNLKPLFSHAFELPYPLDKFFTRVSSEFGIYVCDPFVHYELETVLKVPMKTLDVISLKARGIVSSDQLLTTILSAFSHNIVLVYIKGLQRIPDLLLKWCAEYTKETAYRFIFFEGTDIRSNFSENRDRCNIDHISYPSLEELEISASIGIKTGSTQITTSHFKAVDDFNVETYAFELKRIQLTEFKTLVSGDWKQRICYWLGKVEEHDNTNADFTETDQTLSVAVIFSPPGAGKTHLFEQNLKPFWKERDGIFQSFDCSSKELVEHSLAAVLSSRCPKTTKRLLLVVDEYHMLKKSQKRELFAFLSRRETQKIRAVLIGNRREMEDTELLKEWKMQGINVTEYDARLPLLHIHAYVKLKDSKDASLLTLWYACLRCLFSDDSLTFRNIPQACQSCDDIGTLSQVLLRKLPMLGELACKEITRAIFLLGKQHKFQAFFDQNPNLEQTITNMFVDQDEDPFMLLARVALLSISVSRIKTMNAEQQHIYADDPATILQSSKVGGLDTFLLKSFPEYCVALPGSHTMHPALRLGAWIQFIVDCAKQTIRFPDTVTVNLKILQKLVMIDQPGFPLVVSITSDFRGGSSSIRYCRAFSEIGDYRDLEWIRVSLQKNIAIHWEAVKRTWAKDYISDVIGLLRLIDEAPDPQAVLDAINPGNLFSLLMNEIRSGSKVVLALKTVKGFLQDRGSEMIQNIDEATNPILLCFWIVFFLVPEDHPVRDEMEELSSNTGQSVFESVLLWASCNARDAISTTRSNTSEARLRDALLTVTKNLASQIFESKEAAISACSKLKRLWFGRFALLLDVSEMENNIHLQAAAFVIADDTRESKYWPSLIKWIHRVMRGGATLEGLRVLEEAFESHKLSLDLYQKQLPEAMVSFVSKFSSALINVELDEPLPRCIQFALIRDTPTQWNGESKMLEQIRRKDFASKKFLAGLQELEKSEDILKNWPKEFDSIRKLLKEYFAHLHGVEDRSQTGKSLSSLQNSAKTRANDRLKDDLRLISKLIGIDNPQIMRFYNKTVGQLAIKQFFEKSQEFDEYRNPTTSDYDLGKDGAFRGVRLLVGNFFRNNVRFAEYKCDKSANLLLSRSSSFTLRQWTSPHIILLADTDQKDHQAFIEWSLGNRCRVESTGRFHELPELEAGRLKQNIQARLSKKGFQVEIVEDELDFARSLQKGDFRVAWVISGRARDLASSSLSAGVKRMDRFLDSVARFHKAGGGLFLFAENDPYYFHANSIMSMLEMDCQLVGNNPGKNFVLHPDNDVGDNADLTNQRSDGQMLMLDHPILTGIATLYEGSTISYPSKNPHSPLEVLATGGFGPGDDGKVKPIVLASNSRVKAGRVVIDVGFTKLWLEWTKGGTDRYVTNATTWLVNVEDVLQIAQPGSLEKVLVPRRLQIPDHVSSSPNLAHIQHLIQQDLPPRNDFLVVIDMSGSMGNHVHQAREFCRKMIAELKIGVPGSCDRMGVIGFDNRVYDFGATLDNILTDNPNVLLPRIDQICSRGGTEFAPPLEYAARNVFNGDLKSNRIVLFQTDGDNWDRDEAAEIAHNLIENHKVTIAGVIVGAGAGIMDIVGFSGKYFDRQGAHSQLIVKTSSYTELVKRVATIAETIRSSAI